MYFVLCCCQVVSQYSSILSPICVDAVLRVIDPAKDTNVDLRDIKIIQKLGWVAVSRVALPDVLSLYTTNGFFLTEFIVYTDIQSTS